MKTWFTADTHFSHARIIELCGRPFSSVEEMDKTIIDRINEVVGSKDRLVILGDICMGKLEDSLQNLSLIQAAELVLIPGNHDRWSPAYAKKGKLTPSFLRRAEEFRLKYEDSRPDVIALKAAETVFDDAGDMVSAHVHRDWEFVHLSDEWLDHPLSKVSFSHFPISGDSHADDRYVELRPVDRGQPVVHGHVHNQWHVNGRQYNVGVDVNDFYPVSEETLVEWVRSL